MNYYIWALWEVVEWGLIGPHCLRDQGDGEIHLDGPHFKFGIDLIPLSGWSIAHKFNDFNIWKNDLPSNCLIHLFGVNPGSPITVKKGFVCICILNES